jgi:ubiquinone/menaquinone biosynthesis C-methylase UbiE
MNYISRLLAVTGCCCSLAACGLNEIDAESDSQQITATAAVSNLTGAASVSEPPQPPAENTQAEEPDDAGIDLSQGGVTDDEAEPPIESGADSDVRGTATNAVTSEAGGPPVAEAETAIDNARYTYSDDHDPNGIGKFYMGREIAQVMGHQGIAWLERPEREEEERLSLLIECLEIEPGSTVADIGAGSGVITTRLCDAVGEDGTVVAVDIQQEMLDALQLKCHELGYRNVELVLGTPESPQLVEETLDLVVMVDVYHEFDHPYEMLLEISRALKPGGRVAFVEYRKEDPEVPIKEVHKMSEAQVRLEAEQEDFQLEYVETIDDLPRQHIIVFRRIEPSEET